MNPFEELFMPETESPEGEEVEGAFTCDECYQVMPTARYLEEHSLLTWICDEGHISKVEGFNLA